jgi:hypothetical protein
MLAQTRHLLALIKIREVAAGAWPTGAPDWAATIRAQVHGGAVTVRNGTLEFDGVAIYNTSATVCAPPTRICQRPGRSGPEPFAGLWRRSVRGRWDRQLQREQLDHAHQCGVLCPTHARERERAPAPVAGRAVETDACGARSTTLRRCVCRVMPAGRLWLPPTAGSSWTAWRSPIRAQRCEPLPRSVWRRSCRSEPVPCGMCRAKAEQCASSMGSSASEGTARSRTPRRCATPDKHGHIRMRVCTQLEFCQCRLLPC